MSGAAPQNTSVAIVGGGVSGLYAAYLLEQRGLTDVLLLEVREALGGRILSVPVPEPEPSEIGRASCRERV